MSEEQEGREEGKEIEFFSVIQESKAVSWMSEEQKRGKGGKKLEICLKL